MSQPVLNDLKVLKPHSAIIVSFLLEDNLIISCVSAVDFNTSRPLCVQGNILCM